MSGGLVKMEIDVGLRMRDPYARARALQSLIDDLKPSEEAGLVTIEGERAPIPGVRGDPLVVGALVLSVAPIAVTKVLDFLHDWVLRQESQVIEVEVELPGARRARIVIPKTASKEQALELTEAIVRQLSVEYGPLFDP